MAANLSCAAAGESGAVGERRASRSVFTSRALLYSVLSNSSMCAPPSFLHPFFSILSRRTLRGRRWTGRVGWVKREDEEEEGEKSKRERGEKEKGEKEEGGEGVRG